ncbi:glycerol-3-phosphate O-acyltransferase [Thermotomaculum hydrothermale]|uniref:Glycerol-3-phosphate acyltransferase n=1 Tax=Thermotomaculum hydrothermale TaxID=981385 RepID=A0A7R6PGE0_9BACT|nr:1-acyl-sn-glycerol-3-phosphate acyltransferase [Thermotomaculum hydrothermale]BBB33273.1 glycerol-3-phosphate O-acyltransferase [Thermotomaculum hydrothermale]
MAFGLNHFFKKVNLSNLTLKKLNFFFEEDDIFPIFTVEHRSRIDNWFLKYVLEEKAHKILCYSENAFSFFKDFESQLEYCVQKGRPVALFLKKNNKIALREDFIKRIVALCNKYNKKPVFIPTFILWKKVARREHSNWNFLFGEPDNPRALVKIWQVITGCKKAVIDFGEPFLLDESLSIEELGKVIDEELNKLEKIVIGPPLKERDKIIHLVLNDPEVQAKIEELSGNDLSKKRKLIKKALKILDEMAANYKESVIFKFERTLDWAWPKIIEGFWVNENRLEEYRQLAGQLPALVLPCHKSHADYLIVSYLFFKYNLRMPYIAAGINLSFFPMGYIFRNSGAYFIRRTIKGDKLYPVILQAYIRRLLLDGLPQEFFLEGTRSRTGKLLHPKMGLLSFNTKEVKEGRVKDIVILPTSIIYGKLFESGAYLREMEGRKKEKESAAAVLKTTKFLGKNFGKIYMNFAKPFTVKEFADEIGIDLEQLDEKEFRRFNSLLAYRVLRDIEKETIVTPIALTSLILLSNIKKGLLETGLQRRIAYALTYVKSINAPLADVFDMEDDELLIKKVVDYFIEKGVVEVRELGGKKVYVVDEDKRNYLEYYKNNVIHLFLYVAFISNAILLRKKKKLTIQEIFDDANFLFELFRKEFIYQQDELTVEKVKEELKHLEDYRLVSVDGENITIRSHAIPILKHVASMILSYLEAYYTVLDGYYAIARDNVDIPSNIVSEFIDRGKYLYAMGEITRRESINKFYYQNAHQQFVQSNYVDWHKLFEQFKKSETTEEKEKYYLLKERIKSYISSIAF